MFRARTEPEGSQPLAAVAVAILLIGCVGCRESVLLGNECPSSMGPCAGDDAAMGSGDDGHSDAGAAPDMNAHPDPGADVDACAPSAGGSSEVPFRSLMAHWALDEGMGQSAADVTGQAAAGTLQNFTGDNAWVAGKRGSALQFDGVDDAVQVGAVEGKVKTLSFWLKPATTQVVTRRTPLQLPTSHGPLDQWTSPQNAYADDGVWATAASLIGTQAQHWGGFQLAQHLPQNASVQGITVTVDTGNLGVLGAVNVELSWDGGTTHTDSRYGWGQLIIGSNLRQTGGPDKLWGRTWSAADFSAANFRVRATFGGIANAMSLDYLGVEVEYTEQATPRSILQLNPQTRLEFLDPEGRLLATSGWPGSAIYVNGSLAGELGAGWNHVVIAGPEGVAPMEVRLGMAQPAETLSFPYDGLMDEIILFSEDLTVEQIARLAEQALCEL
jgi:hypothetical protein